MYTLKLHFLRFFAEILFEDLKIAELRSHKFHGLSPAAKLDAMHCNCLKNATLMTTLTKLIGRQC